MVDVLLRILEPLVTIIFVSPIVCAVCDVVIKKYWECKLEYNAKLVLAQAEALKTMAKKRQNNSEND